MYSIAVYLILAFKECPVTYDPYALAFPAPTFILSSPDFLPGAALPMAAYATGANTSPALTWGELPLGTKSVVVTAFDADAPLPGGLWHWAVKDIPASSRGLSAGAGTGEAPALPHPAVHLVNSLGAASYSGVNPPSGTGVHRLFICATALDVAHLEVPVGASLAMVNIALIPRTLGRAILVGTSAAPSA